MTLDEVSATLEDLPKVHSSHDEQMVQALYPRWHAKLVLGADGRINQILVFKEGPVTPTYQGAALFGSLKRVGPALESVGARVVPMDVPGFAEIEATSISLALTESGKSVVGIAVDRPS